MAKKVFFVEKDMTVHAVECESDMDGANRLRARMAGVGLLTVAGAVAGAAQSGSIEGAAAGAGAGLVASVAAIAAFQKNRS